MWVNYGKYVAAVVMLVVSMQLEIYTLLLLFSVVFTLSWSLLEEKYKKEDGKALITACAVLCSLMVLIAKNTNLVFYVVAFHVICFALQVTGVLLRTQRELRTQLSMVCRQDFIKEWISVDNMVHRKAAVQVLSVFAIYADAALRGVWDYAFIIKATVCLISTPIIGLAAAKMVFSRFYRSFCDE